MQQKLHGAVENFDLLFCSRHVRLHRRIRAARNQSSPVRESFRPVGQPLDELFAPLLHLVVVVHIRRQVMLFRGIRIEVKEAFCTVIGTPDVFEAAVGERMERLLLAVAGRMFEM